MLNQMKLHEFDAYALLQSLGNYLKTDMEASPGIIEKKVKVRKVLPLGGA